ncbi:MAG: putative PROLIN-rich signal peptide protein [Herbaspirillum sp.]|nr:putative PROLIN-rich signal peptide protein [Herbaspirillum sp.]
MTSQTPFFNRSSSKRWLFAIAILVATLLLHLIIINWGRKYIGMPAATSEPEMVTISLQKPPATIPLPPPKPKPAPVKPAPKSTPKPPPEMPAPAAPAPVAQQELPPDQSSANTDADAAAVGNTISNTPTAPDPARQQPQPQTPPPRTDAPPSVALQYDVQGLREGQKVYGSGKIIWRNMGDRYRIDGSASVLFFTLLQFSSDGMLDDFGVSPAIYTEKRFHKTATDTRFERARNTITFSASDNHYPCPGDAQDRASIIWQLAAIGRGNPAAFSAGAGFDIFVAGVHDAEPWKITVSGAEDVTVDGDPASAWHVVRLPQPGSYDQKIDIWLAPQQQWYPVKIRYTESNGEFLEMSLSSQTPLQPN